MYGIPLGAPFHTVPKSGCRLFSPQLAMSVAELASTGSFETSWFQALSAGNGSRPFRLAPAPRPGDVVCVVSPVTGGAAGFLSPLLHARTARRMTGQRRRIAVQPVRLEMLDLTN